MIGSRLKELRVAKGLTQKELAASKYSHAYVSVIEAGRRSPSREALEYFAAKLGVDVEELATGRPPDLIPRLELRLQEARVAISSGRFDEADKTFKAVVKEARRLGLPRLEAKAEEGRGLWLERQGKPEEAIEHYQQVEELLRSEPPTATVDAIGGKARCFEALGDVRYAIHILESTLDTLERENLRDPDALARVHASLVFAYCGAGLYKRAADSAAELDRLTPKVSDASRIAQMHMNVARVHLYEGKIDDALQSLRRAEDIYRQLSLETEMGGAHLARGYVLSREGKLKEAGNELRQARAIFEQTANEKDLTRTLNELGRVERLEGRLDAARSVLEYSISLLRESDAPILAWAHRELGFTLFELDPTAAEKSFRVAIELYERAQQVVDIAVTYRGLGDILDRQGDSEAACEAYRTGIIALEPRL